MKKFALLTIVVLLSTRCSESFIERSPFSQYTPEDFYKNEDQITQAVTGLYPIMRGFYTGANWTLGELRSDNTTFQYNAADRGSEAFESHDYFLSDAANGTFAGLWSNAYNGIAKSHYILQNINIATFKNEANRPIREGEARFARAFYYYFLIKYFGDVPFIDKVVTDAEAAGELRREKESRIINEIILPDLDIAIKNLPMKWDLNNVGRSNKAAALMLKSRIHFYLKEYAKALPLLEEIIKSGVYTLDPNFAAVFHPTTKNTNKEVIFSCQFDVAAGQGAGFFINWLPNNSGIDITGTGGVFINALNGKNVPTRDLMAQFEAGDARYDASVGVYINLSTRDTTPYIKKYLHPPILAQGTNVNVPVFRYAETLLMWCEAKMETEGGINGPVIERINEIRARARLPLAFPGNPRANLNINTPEKIKDLLRKERRIELAFEGERFHDLIRYGILESKMKEHGVEQKKYQTFLATFPTAYTNITEKVAIPADQVFIYKYEQNKGW
jgi:starch-binding outer membrane protein, SusD/RagB family